MKFQKPTIEQLRRFALAKDEQAFFRALVEIPALAAYLPPFVGLHQALGLMAAVKMYGNCAKIGVHHPELLTEKAYELLGVLIEGQEDLELKGNLSEVREALRHTLDSGFDRGWGWEQHAGMEPFSAEEEENYDAQRECVQQFLSISTKMIKPPS